MAWRIDHLVIAGELDNTQLGWTVGWLELEGMSERMQLKLAGNCHADLAGWKFRITRSDPEPEPDPEPEFTHVSASESPSFLEGLRQIQTGNVGDITADQMTKHYEMSTDEFLRRLRNGENPPTALRKCLYLEWFGNSNGRVVIQSTRLQVERLGERAFEMTEEQLREQDVQNQQEMNYFMTQLGESFERRSEENE